MPRKGASSLSTRENCLTVNCISINSFLTGNRRNSITGGAERGAVPSAPRCVERRSAVPAPGPGALAGAAHGGVGQWKC